MNNRFVSAIALLALGAFACNALSLATPQPETTPLPQSMPTVGATPTEGIITVPAEVTPTERTLRPTDENELAMGAFDPDPPEQVVKLVFIHHSSGENWLADWSGGLGLALMENNYYVSDTNYDWGPYDDALGGPIGSYTDIGHWYNWFLGPNREAVLDAVYNESAPHADYSRLADDPGGPNEIVMFKSCFPNSALNGNPDDSPNLGQNPLFGLDAWSEAHTVANARGVYTALLDYFATRPDKLFIAITAPPLHAASTAPEQAANARAFNRWLVDEWLKEYPLHNVAVFDFYNVLTSNGGDLDTNDAGTEAGNHHRYHNGQIEYITDQAADTSAYATPDDSHPTAAGNQKATVEFLPLLNIAYHEWVGD